MEASPAAATDLAANLEGRNEMKKMMFAMLFALMLMPAAAQAQDWLAAAPGHKTVLVDNAHMRMVAVTIPPGGKEPMHTHPQYIEYVLDAAKMRVQYAGKEPEIWEPEAGKSYAGEPDPPHSLENIDTKPFRILLIEMKDRPYPAKR